MLGITRKRIYTFLIALGIFFVYALIEWEEFSTKPISRINFTFEVEKGWSIRDILFRFSKFDVKTKPIIFEIVTRITRSDKKIHAGEYLITPETTRRDLLRMMVNGDVVMRKFTLIEGWNTKTLFDEIQKNDYLKNDLSGLTHDKILKKIGVKEKNPEGLFFPETYEFAKNTNASKILREAYNHMKNHLKAEWESRAVNLTYKNPYEALIVASLIEKETSVSEEREKIAAVILNRLKKRMYLQIDPTVIYGMGDKYKGSLARKHLKIDTPYNTYTRKGLPPTPIASPSLASLHAAMHPAKTDALYFVAKGDGTHIFTTNLKAHLAEVANLRKMKAEVK